MRALSAPCVPTDKHILSVASTLHLFMTGLNLWKFQIATEQSIDDAFYML